MKRALSILLLAALLGAMLCGCAPATSAAEGLSVVCTVFPAYDFVREVAGELAEIELLISPGEEAHTFDPTPQDMRHITSCDLFVYTGGPSDSWADTLLSGGAECATVRMVDCVETLRAAEPDHDHGHAEYDEHVWTSPKMAAEIVCGIEQALCDADPANADTYRARAAAYRDKLSGLSQRLQAAADGGSRRTLIFGDRFPMIYFTEELGLMAESAFPGCSSDTEPSAATVAALIDRVKAEGIPVVLKCELSSGIVAEAIAEATGATVRTLHSCHNLTAEEYARGETYLTLMEKNVTTLTEALK